MMMAAAASGPDDPARRLSDATYIALREAIATAWRRRDGHPFDPSPELSAAIRTAAHESRERSLRPEELLVELKHLESEIASVFPAVSTQDRRTLREWLVQQAVRAYFDEG